MKMTQKTGQTVTLVPPQRPSTSKADMILSGRPNFPGCIRQMACTVDSSGVSTRGTSETAWLSLTPHLVHKDAIRRHAGTSMHKAAIQLERLASKRNGGIAQAFSDAISTERKAAGGKN